MGGSAIFVFGGALLQELVPDPLRGRVFAVESGLRTLGLSLSMLLTGWGLDRMGLGARPLAALLGCALRVPGSVWLLLQTRQRFRID